MTLLSKALGMRFNAFDNGVVIYTPKKYASEITTDGIGTLIGFVTIYYAS